MCEEQRQTCTRAEVSYCFARHHYHSGRARPTRVLRKALRKLFDFSGALEVGGPQTAPMLNP